MSGEFFFTVTPRRCTVSGRRGSATETRSEEHTSELQSQSNLVCRLLLEKKNKLLLRNQLLNLHNATTCPATLILIALYPHHIAQEVTHVNISIVDYPKSAVFIL